MVSSIMGFKTIATIIATSININKDILMQSKITKVRLTRNDIIHKYIIDYWPVQMGIYIA